MSANNRSEYQSPLCSRYASKAMRELFSEEVKIRYWRRLWIALAEAEQELGLEISDEQLDELRKFADDVNFDFAKEEEKRLRHDVMSHVHAYGEQCPKARGIIHLGATSCYLTDNTDVYLMREALLLIRSRLLALMRVLRDFAMEYRELPCLGFTHYQAAQPVSLGKRASLWLQDLWLDYQQLDFVLSQMRFRGVKGTTGTQASFMELFNKDEQKVKALDARVTEKMGFDCAFPLTSQTYSRKLDFTVLSVLSALCQSAHKFANDLRLLQHAKELEEPFEKTQVGSSAMAYKRNPMRSERMTSLARYVISALDNPAQTAAEQWLERTLDDSANKRIVVPEAFLATDAVLNLYHNIASGLVVYEKMIERHLNAELPFMATENIMMEAVKRGGDRQELHERIRVLSHEAGRRVKEEGLDNDLLTHIAADPIFHMTMEELQALLDPKDFIGRSSSQVVDFITEVIDPLLAQAFASELSGDHDIEI